MSKWEKDCSKSFTEEERKKAIHTTYRVQSTHCATHWELLLKVLHKWYLTPYKLTKTYPTTDHRCWRQCGELGSLPHILWQCRSIKTFWNKIFSLLSEILGIPVHPDMFLALLHLVIHRIPARFRSVTLHFLLAVKRNIVRRWIAPAWKKLYVTILINMRWNDGLRSKSTSLRNS